MSIKIEEVRNLKKGNYVVIDGEPCKIVDYSSSKPGKHGAAKVRIVATSIFDGKKKQLLTNGGEKADVPIITRRAHQVLSVSGGMAQLMDVESYETVEIAVPEGTKLEEGGEVMVMEAMGRKVVQE
jgi:translation initiation factor 5A